MAVQPGARRPILIGQMSPVKLAGMGRMKSVRLEFLQRVQSRQPGGGLVQVGALLMIVPAADALQRHDHPVFAVLLAVAMAAAHVALLADPPALRDRARLAIRIAGIAMLAGLSAWLSREYSQAWSVAFLLAAWQCAYAFDRPQPALAGGIALALVAGVAFANTSEGWAIIVLACGAIAMLRRRLLATIEELRLARTELADYAVVKERQRFSRDLHDLLGHSLSAIVVTAQLASRKVRADPAAAEQSIADIETTGRTALAEVRQVVSDYRTMSLDDQLRAGEAALRSAGIAVRVERVQRHWCEDVDDVLSWTARESMTNIMRHSHARHAVITLSSEADLIRLRVRDDGDADEAALARARRGLRTLRERIAARHGSLKVALADGGGLELTLEVIADGNEAMA
jgi:two-component system sensor histidine kinase DesK